MKALQIRRNVGRFGAARIIGAVSSSGATKVGPLEYRTIDDPESPGDGWHRVRTRLAGICGSDLSLVGGHASTYFEDWVSFPFVPGHEVVGDLVDGDDAGTRVVLEPVLGHAARGVPLPFEGACPADGDDYAHLATTSPGGVLPAIQTGFCCSTGGGWAPWFWAHESQLHRLGRPVGRRGEPVRHVVESGDGRDVPGVAIVEAGGGKRSTVRLCDLVRGFREFHGEIEHCALAGIEPSGAPVVCDRVSQRRIAGP